MLIDKILNIDCLVGLKQLPTESIDCVVTDCPYTIAHHGTCKGGGIFADNGMALGGGYCKNSNKDMELDKIYNEDCLVGMKELPDESIDCVVSDCPYEVVGGGCSAGNYKTAKGHSQPSGMLDRQRVAINDEEKAQIEAVRAGKMFAFNDIKFSDWLPEVYRVLKKGTHCYIMINSRNLKELQIEAEKVGFVFQNLLVWDKSNMAGTPNKYYMQKCEFILMLSKRPARNINDMGQSNLLSCPNPTGKANTHPTAKPPRLMQVLIENSTNKGDIVLDPFMGSGATAIACTYCDRHFLGYEIDPKYYELSQKLLYRVPRQQSLF